MRRLAIAVACVLAGCGGKKSPPPEIAGGEVKTIGIPTLAGSGGEPEVRVKLKVPAGFRLEALGYHDYRQIVGPDRYDVQLAVVPTELPKQCPTGKLVYQDLQPDRTLFLCADGDADAATETVYGDVKLDAKRVIACVFHIAPGPDRERPIPKAVEQGAMDTCASMAVVP